MMTVFKKQSSIEDVIDAAIRESQDIIGKKYPPMVVIGIKTRCRKKVQSFLSGRIKTEECKILSGFYDE